MGINIKLHESRSPSRCEILHPVAIFHPVAGRSRGETNTSAAIPPEIDTTITDQQFGAAPWPQTSSESKVSNFIQLCQWLFAARQFNQQRPFYSRNSLWNWIRNRPSVSPSSYATERCTARHFTRQFRHYLRQRPSQRIAIVARRNNEPPAHIQLR